MLLKKLSVLTLGNAIFAACQWVLLIILARQLSVEAVGEYGYAMAIVAPLTIIGQLALRQALATDYDHKVPFQNYWTLRLYGTVVTVIIIAVIALLQDLTWGLTLAIIILAFAKAAENLSDILYGAHQQAETLTPITRSLIARGIGGLIGLSAGIWLGGTLWAGLIGLGIVWLAVFCLHDWLKRPQNNQKLPQKPTQTSPLLPLFAHVFPLALALGITSFNVVLPRYFLKFYTSTTELGVFTGLVALIALGSIVINALGQGLSPRLAAALAKRDAVFMRKALIFVNGGIIVAGIFAIILCHFIGKWGLNLLYGPEFAEHSYLLPWVVLAAVIHYIAGFLIYCCTAARAFKLQLIQSTLVCLGGLALGAWLVPYFGNLGAIWTLTGMAIMNALTLRALIGWTWHKNGQIKT